MKLINCFPFLLLFSYSALAGPCDGVDMSEINANKDRILTRMQIDRGFINVKSLEYAGNVRPFGTDELIQEKLERVTKSPQASHLQKLRGYGNLRLGLAVGPSTARYYFPEEFEIKKKLASCLSQTDKRFQEFVEKYASIEAYEQNGKLTEIRNLKHERNNYLSRINPYIQRLESEIGSVTGQAMSAADCDRSGDLKVVTCADGKVYQEVSSTIPVSRHLSGQVNRGAQEHNGVPALIDRSVDAN